MNGVERGEEEDDAAFRTRVLQQYHPTARTHAKVCMGVASPILAGTEVALADAGENVLPWRPGINTRIGTVVRNNVDGTVDVQLNL